MTDTFIICATAAVGFAATLAGVLLFPYDKLRKPPATDEHRLRTLERGHTASQDEALKVANAVHMDVAAVRREISELKRDWATVKEDSDYRADRLQRITEELREDFKQKLQDVAEERNKLIMNRK